MPLAYMYVSIMIFMVRVADVNLRYVKRSEYVYDLYGLQYATNGSINCISINMYLL